MDVADKNRKMSFLGAKHLFWVLALAGTICVAASWAWTAAQDNSAIVENAKIQARVAYEKDMLYRRWNASRGPVYVPVTEETQPDPFLSDFPERDIQTPSGKKLTLMHPTYMTRQAFELAEKESGVYGHITSLTPLRSANAPTSWEKEALLTFERGGKEFSSLDQIGGREYLNFMRPLTVDQACLKCHEGDREGQVRGGIRVSIPMQPLRTVQHRHIRDFTLAHGLIWIIGMGAIGLWTQRLRQSERRREWAENELRRYSGDLEILVQERTAELKSLNDQLRREVGEKTRAEEALRESEGQLHELILQRLKAQETERRRISRELHDELGGALAVFKIRLNSIAKGLDRDKGELKQECRESLEYVDEVIENVYRIARDLSPHLLEDLGLSAALNSLITQFRKNYDVAVQANIQDVDHLFTRDGQVILYRIMQETLTNVGKHADAKNISVSIQEQNETVELIVEDDGRGFNTGGSGKKDEGEMGLGLRTIKERARLLEGSVEVRSQKGRGTRIRVCIPEKKRKGES